MSISSNLLNSILKLAMDIQQISAPTFHEGERAEFVLRQFEQLGLFSPQKDEAGNVFACLPGTSGGAELPVVISAHLDTVFPGTTNLRLSSSEDRIAGPGIGDNSLGVASLIGLVWLLRERRISPPGDIWLAANVCEEGLGDLRGMRAVVEKFGADVQGYIVVEGMGLGRVFHRGLGVQRYRVTVRTPGGHSWIDYGAPSAVHEIAALVKCITDLKLPAHPRTTLNVGRIGGGTSVNTIASEAWFELDLRSEDPEALKRVEQQALGLVHKAARPGVNGTLAVETAAELIGSRPPGEIPAGHWLVRLAQDTLTGIGIKPVLGIGSTDANIPLSLGIPAICIGMTLGTGAHTVGEYIHTEPASLGMEQLAGLASRAWDIAGRETGGRRR